METSWKIKDIYKYLAACVCVIYIERYNSEGETASHIFMQWLPKHEQEVAKPVNLIYKFCS
jgi:hypothetical protein